ncbi:High-affinity branched-chain amino acid transport ATP-binding protein LivF [Candidatus Entotheonellaceae bacterium PAL068K]
MPIHERARAGIGYVPQGREVFPSLTVVENLLVGARPGPWTMARVVALFPLLAARSQHLGNQLSGGEQQMLAIAWALMGNPSVLLIDEPSEGLAPVLIEDLCRALQELRADQALSMVLAWQNTRLALDFAPRTVVMDRGRIVYDGDSVALQADPSQLDRLIGMTENECVPGKSRVDALS